MASDQRHDVAAMVRAGNRPVRQASEVDEELDLRGHRNGHRDGRERHIRQEPIMRVAC